MDGSGHGMSLDTTALLIAAGFLVTLLALVFVFGGFFAERRLRDRLEDLDARTRSGPRKIQMATLRRVEKAGRLPSLDRLLWRWFPNASSVRQKLQTSGMSVTLGDFVFASLALAVAVAFLLTLVLDLSPGIALTGSLAIGFGLPNMVVGMKAKKRARKFNLLFPEAVDLIVRALRAGLPIQEAIANVARDIKDPVGTIFKRAQQEIHLGVPLETALWRVAKTVRTDEFNFLIVALSIQRETGGNLAETLSNLADVLRKRAQMKLKIRAMSSESKASAYIVGSLPFVVFSLVYMINPSYMSKFFTDERLMVGGVGGLIWMGIGAAIMAKMVNFEI